MTQVGRQEVRSSLEGDTGVGQSPNYASERSVTALSRRGAPGEWFPGGRRGDHCLDVVFGEIAAGARRPPPSKTTGGPEKSPGRGHWGQWERGGVDSLQPDLPIGNKSCPRYQHSIGNPGLAPGFFLLHPSRAGRVRHRRAYLPVPTTAALPATWLAGSSRELLRRTSLTNLSRHSRIPLPGKLASLECVAVW